MAASFDKVEAAIKGAVSVAALAPGIAVFASAVKLPPTLQTLLGGLSVSMGAIVVLAVFLFGSRLHRVSGPKVGVASLVLGVAGILVGVFFWTFARSHILAMQPVGEEVQYLVLPLQPQGSLAEVLGEFDGDYREAISNPNVSALVLDEIQRQSGSAVWLLAVSLLTAQTLVLTAIVIGAWKLADRPGEPEAGDVG